MEPELEVEIVADFLDEDAVVSLVLDEDVRLIVGQHFSNPTRSSLLNSETNLSTGVIGRVTRPEAASDHGSPAEADKAAKKRTANIRVEFIVL